MSSTSSGMRFQKGRGGECPPIASVKTHSVAHVHPAARREARGSRTFILDPREGGPSERLGALFGGGHPVVVFFVVMFGGLAAIAALSIGLGVLVTHVIETGSIGAADERFNVWLAAHRTPTRTDASLIGSIIAGGVVLPIVAGVLALAAAGVRHWRLAAFFVFALAVESATYRLTTLAVHSHRPRVHRLESLPVNASYPSGHTAAAIAVYCGLALLITSRFRNDWFRMVAWLLAVATVAFVAMARMYRGMHHPLDVAGGVVVGIAALCVLVLACRSAGAAAE
jgi:membrane-associated phospholipid phosphatase